MTGQAVIRTVFVIALMITAHAIKPFSLDNVTTQMLSTARSLSFVLPEAAVASIEHANFLAAALGVGAHEAQDSSMKPLLGATLAQQVLADVQIAPEEVGQPVKKGKIVKRLAALKRAVRASQPELASIIATQAPVALLPVVPALDEAQLLLARPVIHAFTQSLPFTVLHEVSAWSASLSFMSRQTDCEPRDAKSVRMVAIFEERGKLKLITSSAKPKAIDCPPATDAIEVEAAPVIVGPEEQTEHAVESQATATQAVETQAVEMQATDFTTSPASACPVNP